MDFLKDALGEELYGSVESKLNDYNGANKGKEIKLMNLNDGGYVSIDKFNTSKTELDGVKEQLQKANETLESYKNMDIEGIKKSVDDWKTKYDTDTAALQDKMSAQQKEFAARDFISGKGFKSKLAQKAALTGLMDLDLKDGKFVGADDYIKQLKADDPDSFIQDESEGKSDKPQNWVRSTGNKKKEIRTSGDEEAYLKSKYANNKYFKGGTE